MNELNNIHSIRGKQPIPGTVTGPQPMYKEVLCLLSIVCCLLSDL
jgi:hypothetical protein